MPSKNFYAVIKGDLPRPTIFSSQAKAQKTVAGYPGNIHQGFSTLDQAQSFMASKGIENPELDIDKWELPPVKPGEPKMPWFYAVAEGREIGIWTSWSETALRVQGFPGSCYKRFRKEEEAVAFIVDPVCDRLLKILKGPENSTLSESDRFRSTSSQATGPSAITSNRLLALITTTLGMPME